MNRFIVNYIITGWKKSALLCRKKKALPSIFESSGLGYTILLLCCLNISNVHGVDQESNVSYVDECRTDCARLRDPFTCGKFRAVQWLHNFTTDKDIRYGSFRFIRLSSTPEESILPEVPRFRGFSRYSKFLNFVRSSAEDMLTRRALVYTMEQRPSGRSLSSGPLILDTEELDDLVESGRSAEDRILHKKKKKAVSVVLPLLILLKVLKMKLLLIPILIGVHFIKKILLIAALAIPSFLSHLKYCKIPPMHHHATPYSGWATAADTPIDFSLASGHEDDGWNQKIDMMGYGGVGAHDSLAHLQRNPYRGYYQALKQQQQLHNAV